MAQYSKTDLNALYNTVFADNETRDISEGDMRQFKLDLMDSLMSISDNFIDEDSLASDSATKAPSQQSVKAYVDANSFANPMTTGGDIIYCGASGVPTRLAGVATGNALISGGVAIPPSWGKIGLTTHVTGTLPVANGGTGATTLTGVLVGNGTSAVTAVAGTALQVLRRNSGNTAYEFATISTGITNSAANNELMKSDGTNAVASGVFVVSGLTGVGTSSPDRHFHLERADNIVGSVGQVFRITHLTTTGTIINGIGVGMEFEVETTDNNNEVLGAIDVVATDVSAGSENGDFVIRLMQDGSSAAEKLRITSLGLPVFNSTVTGGGTTGNQTINKASGTVNFAAAASTLTVTNSLVTTSSIVFAVVRTNDGTATIKNVVPGAGSFVITLSAAATAETSVGFFVINQ
jgi:hypothetical protein